MTSDEIGPGRRANPARTLTEHYPRSGLGEPRCGLQIPCNQLELLQRGLQVLDDLLRNHGRRRQVVAIGQAVVFEPEDV